MREVRPTESARRDGLYLDISVLDHEAAIRGITMRQLAKKAGVREETLSRIRRRGTRVREVTLRRLVDALKKIPILEGAELLVAVPPAKSIEIVPPVRRRSHKRNDASTKKEAPHAASPARRA